MIASATAISVRGLSKSYTIAHNAASHNTLAEAVLARARRPFARSSFETFWALKEVSFDVERGDVVGIIGRNGAGKSTLLKVLSRITEPTSGEVQLFGRVGSLLEVGTGFHPELTGRENIYLNGQILGMRKKEIDTQFDAIVDFSGCERFLDTPVKRYSSGMYVRLAFAVAAHLQSEILVVDEVLAVGDAEFQRKCMGKMRDVATGGRTVIFVSHHMQSVSLLCKCVIVLKSGQVQFVGNTQEGIDLHLKNMLPSSGVGAADASRRHGTGELRFTSVRMTKDIYNPDEPKTVRFEIAPSARAPSKYFLSAEVVDDRGAVLLQCDSRLTDGWFNSADALKGEFSIKQPWLRPGEYSINLYICCNGPIIDIVERACTFTVSPIVPYRFSAAEDALAKGAVLPDFRWDVS